MLPDVYGACRADREALARRCLADLSFPMETQGTRFLVCALELVSRREGLGSNLNCRLYPYLAERFESTPSRVERVIRYSIEAAWSRCRPEMAERYFGYTTDPEKGKPTNREFINTLAVYLRDHCA